MVFFTDAMFSQIFSNEKYFELPFSQLAVHSSLWRHLVTAGVSRPLVLAHVAVVVIMITCIIIIRPKKINLLFPETWPKIGLVGRIFF